MWLPARCGCQWGLALYRSSVMRVPSGTAPPLYLPARGARQTQEASHLSPVAHSLMLGMMLASGITLQVWLDLREHSSFWLTLP